MKKRLLLASAIIVILGVGGGAYALTTTTPTKKTTTVKTEASPAPQVQTKETIPTQTTQQVEQAAPVEETPTTSQPVAPTPTCTASDQNDLNVYEDDLARLKEGYATGAVVPLYYNSQSHILNVNIQSELDKGCSVS